MARRKTGMVAEEDEPMLDISSLIDVCFLLLIYFIVTSTIQPREQDLPMTMPSSQPSDEVPDIEPMLISVSPSGAVSVNKAQVDGGTSGRERVYPNLKSTLAEYSAMAKSSEAKPIIQVFVNGDCPQQVVIDVLNCIRGADIQTVTFTDTE